jgi:hypothetical protein
MNPAFVHGLNYAATAQLIGAEDDAGNLVAGTLLQPEDYFLCITTPHTQ